MKTAMQEAIELVKKYDNREIPMKVLFYNLELLQEKEKEQIMDAYISDRIPCSEQDAEDYYFSMYKIEKITITEHNQNK
jgi:hypothetical protein